MSDTAETVGEVVAADTAAAIDTTIESANARADAAEAVAEMVVEGALENERAQKILQLETELAKCRETISRLEMASAEQMPAMEALIAETLQGVAAANGDALATLTARLETLETQRQLTPLPLDEPPVTETVVTPTSDAETPVTSVTETVVTEKPARRHRFL